MGRVSYKNATNKANVGGHSSGGQMSQHQHISATYKKQAQNLCIGV